ncbi:hypothetical protein AB6A40_005349 [Gnathostoma spinigerum]|uniref:C3H1-type domain-containing protein n=1 Tax=Gnathostoma spinigerum TaxID=75299 RepID=A0ABD6EGB2_9BILA
MSENGDTKPILKDDKKSGGQRDDVCRDFLKNICNRGSRCKFYHPENIERNRDSSSRNSEFNFCIDFQNRGCQRENCRFVHAPRDDVDRYKMTGEVTLNLARAIAAVHNGDTINGIPFCKEFQTGSCSRGAQRCRYWHINVEEERDRRRRQSRGLPPLPLRAGPLGPYGYSSASGGGSGSGGGPFGVGSTTRRPLPYDAFEPVKRSRYDDPLYVQDLERKNAELTKEIEGLKRELQRERERYEDLYALFRQHSAGGGGGSGGAAESSGGGYGGGMSAYGSSAGSSGYHQNSLADWAGASRSHWSH